MTYKKRWVISLASVALVATIALTRPAAGEEPPPPSDLAADIEAVWMGEDPSPALPSSIARAIASAKPYYAADSK